MSNNRSEDSYIFHDIIPALEQYGYPGAGQSEKLKIKDIKIKVGSGWKETDVVYYEGGDPILLVEAKKNSGHDPLSQAFSYVKLFPAEEQSKNKVRPKYFATTEGKHVTGFYHYVPRFDDRGELLEEYEKLDAIPTYQELLQLLGMSQSQPALTPEIFEKEVFNNLLRAFIADKEKQVDPPIILLVVRQIYEYLLNNREYTNKYPLTILDGHPDYKNEVRRALETYNWDAADHEQIALTFKDLIKRAFQGDRAQLNQFITPPDIINFMLKIVSPSPNDTVLDFECGSGGFLGAALSASVKPQNISGIEINELPYFVTKTFLALYQNIHGNQVESIPVILGNGLIDVNGKYSVIVSNPAGGSKYDPEGELADLDQVIAALSNDINLDGAEDRGYSEYYFSIQRAITSASPNAKICLVLPEGIFANSTDSKLREYISRLTTVKAIISLPRYVFSKGTTTKQIKPGGKTSSQKFSILYCIRNNNLMDDNTATHHEDYPVFLATIDDKDNLENKLAAIYDQYTQWTSLGSLTNKIKIEKPLPQIKSKPTQPALVEPEYPLFNSQEEKNAKPKQTTTTIIADQLKSLFK